MTKFRYRAVSGTNQLEAGILEAPSREAIAKTLMGRGLVVIDVRPQSRLSTFWDLLNKDITSSARLSPRDVAALAVGWGGLLEAGLPIDDALAISARGLKNQKLRQLVERLKTRVEEGQAFHRALETEPGAFSETFIAMIRGAEVTSTLGPTLTRIAGEVFDQQKFRSELRNAMLYPAFVAVTAGAAILVLLIVVVPNIETLFSDAGKGHLPLATQAIFGASRFLRTNALSLMIGIVVIAASLISWSQTKSGRYFFARLVLHLPVIGRMVRIIETGRFLRLLSELLAGGVPMERAAQFAVSAVKNVAMSRLFATLQTEIRRGTSLNRALAINTYLPSEAVDVIRIGEETGKLVDLSMKTAKLYEQEARLTTSALSTMIGPIFTILFGTIAGTIVYAIMSTILSLNELAYQ